MKKAILLMMTLLATQTFAASSIGNGPGLADSGLKQFQCTIEIQEINPKNGNRGQNFSTTYIALASTANEAKAVTLNKLDIYGPVEGSLFYRNSDRRQFEVQGISCN